MPATQMRVWAAGWATDHASPACEVVGLPNCTRSASASVVTGFHSATRGSASGIVSTGTNVLARNVSDGLDPVDRRGRRDAPLVEIAGERAAYEGQRHERHGGGDDQGGAHGVGVGGTGGAGEGGAGVTAETGGLSQGRPDGSPASGEARLGHTGDAVERAPVGRGQ